MANKEMIEEKIGEALGLEKAAQKAVEQLDSRGLLEPEHMKKLSKMKEEASTLPQQLPLLGNERPSLPILGLTSVKAVVVQTNLMMKYEKIKASVSDIKLRCSRSDF
jgi:hypothetical protein